MSIPVCVCMYVYVCVCLFVCVCVFIIIIILNTCTIHVSPASDQVFLPELMHNLELLVDQTEHSILQSDRKLQYNQDLIVNLTHEKNRLQQTMIEEKEQILKLTEIMAVVDM